MKNFLLITLAAIFTLTAINVQAQYTKQVGHTITKADTITFAAVPGKIKAFAYTLTKTSGTVAGKVYLEGGVIAGQWVILDSLTLADVATIQSKVTPISATSYLNYRFRCTNTSNATAVVKAAYFRRTDE